MFQLLAVCVPRRRSSSPNKVCRPCHLTLHYVCPGKAINSLDVSSDGARLATAGSNGKIRIWTMQAVLDHLVEQDSSLPKKLATLTDHTEVDINIVRFSPDGTFLASAGDDQAVFLYKLLPGRGGTSFGSGDEGPNIENWKISKAFR